VKNGPLQWQLGGNRKALTQLGVRPCLPDGQPQGRRELAEYTLLAEVRPAATKPPRQRTVDCSVSRPMCKRRLASTDSDTMERRPMAMDAMV
jgi:hypothetical protein